MQQKVASDDLKTNLVLWLGSTSPEPKVYTFQLEAYITGSSNYTDSTFFTSSKYVVRVTYPYGKKDDMTHGQARSRIGHFDKIKEAVAPGFANPLGNYDGMNGAKILGLPGGEYTAQDGLHITNLLPFENIESVTEEARFATGKVPSEKSQTRQCYRRNRKHGLLHLPQIRIEPYAGYRVRFVWNRYLAVVCESYGFFCWRSSMEQSGIYCRVFHRKGKFC